MDLGSQARQQLIDFVPKLDLEVSKYLDQELKNRFGFSVRQKRLVKQIVEHVREYALRPQKRLRGSFVYYGYSLSGKRPTKSVLQACVGIELVHAALLMHDDFMDQDRLRRGKSTTQVYFADKFKSNAHFGDSMAVNVGDATLCLGFELIASLGNTAATGVLLRGTTNTAYGQAFDISLPYLGKWQESDILTLHRAKTAIYTYGNPLLIGACLAGVTTKIQALLKAYAKFGGIAFQLRDDVLGVFGDPGETGKSDASDLLQGKCTLLALKAMHQPNFKKVWGNLKATPEQILLAKQAIVDSGSRDYSLKLMKTYAHKAVAVCHKLRKLDVDTKAVDYLEGIAQYMVERVA